MRAIWQQGWGLAAIAGVAMILAGCSSAPKTSQQRDQEIRQQTAQATQNVKQGAKVAAADARAAAATAERRLDDVAAGVKEGLHNNGPAKPAPGQPARRLDVNSAEATDLESLPGITPERARRIIDNRPYDTSHDLVTKGALTEAQYERISPQVTAR